MTTTAFNSAQQALYTTLRAADPAHVTIARKMVQAFLANPNTSQRPEDHGAPAGTPSWDAIEDAVETFDRDTGHMKDHVMALAFVQVIDAVLVEGTDPSS